MIETEREMKLRELELLLKIRRLRSEGREVNTDNLKMNTENADRFGFPSEMYSIMDYGCDFDGPSNIR